MVAKPLQFPRFPHGGLYRTLNDLDRLAAGLHAPTLRHAGSIGCKLCSINIAGALRQSAARTKADLRIRDRGQRLGRRSTFENLMGERRHFVEALPMNDAAGNSLEGKRRDIALGVLRNAAIPLSLKCDHK